MRRPLPITVCATKIVLEHSPVSAKYIRRDTVIPTTRVIRFLFTRGLVRVRGAYAARTLDGNDAVTVVAIDRRDGNAIVRRDQTVAGVDVRRIG